MKKNLFNRITIIWFVLFLITETVPVEEIKKVYIHSYLNKKGTVAWSATGARRITPGGHF